VQIPFSVERHIKTEFKNAPRVIAAHLSCFVKNFVIILSKVSVVETTSFELLSFIEKKADLLIPF
jgi:hypothetical protein